MPVNQASSFSSDISNYIADEVLPLTQKQLVVYQFGDPARLPKGFGTTYTATRFARIALPFATLSEGVPPIGETMSISQVTATAQQWGDKVTITDVGELTIKHPLFQQAIELTGLQVSETLERNTFNALLAGTQINYVNSRGARASLVAGDVLNPHEIQRVVATFATLGVPKFSGQTMTDEKMSASDGQRDAGKDPRSNPYLVAVGHPLPFADLAENSTIQTAWSYSDVNKLYNAELGMWRSVRFCESNMVPTFTGVAQVNGSVGTSGSLATNTYYIRVTGSDTQNQYESLIYQVSTANAVVGPTGSISVTVPSTAGYTYNVYIGTTTTPTNLGLSASGPTVGPYAGQATQIAAGSTVIITGTGLSQTPPAAPATGVTVYPTFVFGRGAYAQVVLDDVKFTYLKDADKSDPLNQLRVVGWKAFYGTLLKNPTFFCRIESTSAFSSTFG